MKALHCVTAALVAGLAAGGALADNYEITNGSEYSLDYDYGGMGAGRGVSFLATQDFTIHSMGIDIALMQEDSTLYNFEIYSSTNGHDAGDLLASVSKTLAAAAGWHDAAMDFTFQSGDYYVINFERADHQWLDGVGTHYAWEGGNTAVSYGPFTVVEGFADSPPNNGNPLIPYMRMSTDASAAVPEPASWAMMLGGFGLVGGALRSRQKAAVSFA